MNTYMHTHFTVTYCNIIVIRTRIATSAQIEVRDVSLAKKKLRLCL